MAVTPCCNRTFTVLPGGILQRPSRSPLAQKFPALQAKSPSEQGFLTKAIDLVLGDPPSSGVCVGRADLSPSRNWQQGGHKTALVTTCADTPRPTILRKSRIHPLQSSHSVHRIPGPAHTGSQPHGTQSKTCSVCRRSLLCLPGHWQAVGWVYVQTDCT